MDDSSAPSGEELGVERTDMADKDYLRTMVCDKLGLDMVEGTRMSKQAVEELEKQLPASA